MHTPRVRMSPLQIILPIVIVVGVVCGIALPVEARGPDQFPSIREKVEERLSVVRERVAERKEALCDRLAARGVPRLPAFCATTPQPPMPPTVDLDADESSIVSGESVTLSWTSQNTTACTASGDWSGTKALSGTEVRTPSATATYTLTCTGEGGSASDTVVVVATNPPPPPTLTLFDLIEADDTLSTLEAALIAASLNGALDNEDALLTVFAPTNAAFAMLGTSTIEALLADIPALTNILLYHVVGDELTAAEVVALPSITMLNGESTTITVGEDGVRINNSFVIEVNRMADNGVLHIIDAVLIPESEPAPLPIVDLSADEVSIISGESVTLSWTSQNTTACTASGDWSGTKALSGTEVRTPSATATYTLTCDGPGGQADDTIIVAVTPPPTPEGLLLISEVYYFVATTTGGVDPANEWVEIYNGTNDVVDLSGYVLADALSSDTIPNGILLLPGAYAVISSTSTTFDLWTIPSDAVRVVLDSLIGNGLANGGDALFLRAPDAALVDSVSWGTNVSAFNPSVPVVSRGRSMERINLTIDTDTAADWREQPSPTPGGPGPVIPD